MNICFIIFLILIIVIVIIIQIIQNSEKYKNYPDIPDKSINIYSCWDHIKKTTDWDLDVLTNEQVKVLLTFRPLNAKIYSDDNKEFPDWRNKCVIPAEHLPIFNQDPNKNDIWVIKNNILKYTNISEIPKGFTIELDKHTEKSFKKLLLDLYELYDREFLDEEKRLQKEIDDWAELKKIKTIQLNDIKTNILKEKAILNSMLDPNSECQKNKNINENLEYQINKIRAEITSVEESIPVIPPMPPALSKFQENKPIVEIWQHCDYNGWKITLEKGRYNLNDLTKRGFINNDSSSIKFLGKGSVTIFSDDNFQGNKQTFTNSVNCLVDYNFNDIVSSIIVT